MDGRNKKGRQDLFHLVLSVTMRPERDKYETITPAEAEAIADEMRQTWESGGDTTVPRPKLNS
ncbi:MAG: hypothetical protein HY815_10110 [Candidatus Riflebacteria bacterium]|nr:hypothetical protein [Candidatus Riflebacteria bacterium]